MNAFVLQLQRLLKSHMEAVSSQHFFFLHESERAQPGHPPLLFLLREILMMPRSIHPRQRAMITARIVY